MEVKCNRCSQDHSIPDSSVANRRIYFFCSRCGHKIIVNGEKTFVQNQNTTQIREHKALPVFKNILDAVTFSFNPIIIMMSFVFCITAFTLLFFFAVLFSKEISFFAEYQFVPILIAAIIIAAIIYGYSVLLYLISKLQMEKSETNKAGPIDWEFILFDFKDDCIALLFFSLLVPIIFFMLLSPIYFLGGYGFLYAAIFSPLLFVLSLIVIFSLLFYNLIPSIISSESLSPIESIMNVFLFVRRELINIPFYLMMSQIAYLFISSMVIFLFGSAFLLSLCGVLYAIDPVLKTNALVFLMSLKSIVTTGFQSSGGFDSITIGYAIIFFFVFIISQILLSYNIALHQTLIAQSCWIMNKNKENSVSKNAILVMLGMIILTALLIIYFVNIHLLQSVQF